MCGQSVEKGKGHILRYYDIVTYNKHWEDLDKAVVSTPMATAAHQNDYSTLFDVTTPRIPSTTSVPPMQSQDDDLSIMTMVKYVDHLLTMFGDV